MKCKMDSTKGDVENSERDGENYFDVENSTAPLLRFDKLWL